jgi:hypothetical protein
MKGPDFLRQFSIWFPHFVEFSRDSKYFKIFFQNTLPKFYTCSAWPSNCPTLCHVLKKFWKRLATLTAIFCCFYWTPLQQRLRQYLKIGQYYHLPHLFLLNIQNDPVIWCCITNATEKSLLNKPRIIPFIPRFYLSKLTKRLMTTKIGAGIVRSV